MELGTFNVHETIMQCACCKARHSSEELQSLVPHGCKFGFNVIVHVGKALFVRGLNEHATQQELLNLNIHASLNEIGYLGKKFIAYLALAHDQSKSPIKELLRQQGGYILHLDSTCEGDSPMLMSGLDEISNIVLDNVKLPYEKTESIIPFLGKIKTALGVPLAVVSDMSKGIAAAIKEAFLGVAHFICHFHFLRDIGKDLLWSDYEALRRTFKSYGLKKRLRELSKKCRVEIAHNPQDQKAFDEYLEKHAAGNPTQPLPASVLAYTLILWILNGRKNAQGNGFPFDRPYLTIYQRLATVEQQLIQLNPLLAKNHFLNRLMEIIQEARQDKVLLRVIERLEERVAVFDRLRVAMRIATPDSKKSLKDNGEFSSLTPIKNALSAFRNDKDIIKLAATQQAYKKMLKQIDNSWTKLFADPIKILTPSGQKLIYPQRTNNILERFFRTLKRSLRRKTGNHSLSRTFTALLADTALIQNLKNDQYLKLILNGKASLEERFAQIDAQQVTAYLAENCQQSHCRIPLKLKKILLLPNLPEKLLVNTFS